MYIVPKNISSRDMSMEEVLTIMADTTQQLTPEEQFLIGEGHEELYKAINTLPEREQQVLKLRYGFEDGVEYTLEEIGNMWDVGRERVRQIELRAIRHLRHPGMGRNLQRYTQELAGFSSRPYESWHALTDVEIAAAAKKAELAMMASEQERNRWLKGKSYKERTAIEVAMELKLKEIKQQKSRAVCSRAPALVREDLEPCPIHGDVSHIISSAPIGGIVRFHCADCQVRTPIYITEDGILKIPRDHNGFWNGVCWELRSDQTF